VPDPLPQPVLAPLTPAAIFLVATIDEDGEQAVHDALPDISGLVRAIGFRDPTKHLSVVTSIGSEAWDRLFSGPRPAELHPFIELDGPRHHAPSTPGDLLFHIRAESMDVCFELATKLVEAMDAITVVDEVHGFRFFDNRDLLGFVDGTENPDGPLAVSATQIGDEDPDFAGGCYVHVQKYVHDMSAWNSLSVTEQERVIGRTKLDDIELDDDEKPANSHVALNVIEDDEGNELKIVRHNMPFGEIGKGEFGTYFIGYSRTAAVTEQMLSNMFIGDPPGNTDRILDFSTAVTGAMFFTPTVDFLNDPPPLGDSVPEPATVTVVPDRYEGSLGIGSLKGIPG
jgi:porphyrinogen peroxidase